LHPAGSGWEAAELGWPGKRPPRHSRGRQLRCPYAPATQPGVPSGPVFTKKPDAFNNTQSIFVLTHWVALSVTMLPMSVCVRFKETSICRCTPERQRHKAGTAGGGLQDRGGKKREVPVLRLAEVGESFPADTNPDSSLSAQHPLVPLPNPGDERSATAQVPILQA